MQKTIVVCLILYFFNFSISSAQNSVVNLYETNIVVSSQHYLKKSVSISITINNKKGEDLTRIEIPYSKNNKIQNLEARIEDLNGQIIRKLKPGEIVDKSNISDFSLFEDDFVKSFDLRHNTYPYKIFFSYTIVYENFIAIADWNPVIDIQTPTNYASLKLSVPKTYGVTIYTNQINTQKSDTTDTEIIYEFIGEYKKPLKKELYSFPFYDRIPSVVINPMVFDYGVPGKFDSWNSFGNWVCDLNEGLNDLTESEKQTIDRLLKGIDSKREKLNVLYDYLQTNTRYINVSIDIGGLKPYPASYVCTNKYGDCKALSNYMKSMLEYVGISANYTLVYAGDNPLKTIENRIIDRFNHIILFVPLEHDTVWLECTSNFNPPGYLGTSTQNRLALVAERDNSKLLRTPILRTDDVKETSIYTITPETDASANLFIKRDYKGDKFETVSYIHHSYNKQDSEDYIHHLIPANDYQLIKWSINETNKKDSSIQVELNIKIPEFLKTHTDFFYTGIIPLEIPHFEKPEKRTSDVRINFPIHKQDSIIMHPIEGFSYSLLTDTCITSSYGSYTIHSKLSKGILTIFRQLIINAGDYDLEQYPDFYKFLQSIRIEEQKKAIVLNKNK